MASWSMLFFGAQTFTSCDDEDDDKDSKTSVVAESIVGTWAYNASESKATSEDVYNYFDFDEITFNADNTFVGMEDSIQVASGKYTISGNDFKMEGTVDGDELTLVKGDVIEKAAGIDNGVSFEYELTVKNYTVAVDGDKLTFNLDVEYLEKTDGKVSETETFTVTSVYNKKK